MLVEMARVEGVPAIQFGDDGQMAEPIGLKSLMEIARRRGPARGEQASAIFCSSARRSGWGLLRGQFVSQSHAARRTRHRVAGDVHGRQLLALGVGFGIVHVVQLLDRRRDRAVGLPADPEAYDKREQLTAMDISCEAVLLFARRHAELAANWRRAEPDPATEGRTGKDRRGLPARTGHPPRDFHEALQAYWFCHLAVITELNGWDSFSPGHLDQHLCRSTAAVWTRGR